MIYDSNFTRFGLWHGCLLATVAHAIFVARHPELGYEQSWDGSTYNIQDSQGSFGAITFNNENVVGAFFDSHSSRNPWISGKLLDLSGPLKEMPPALRALAEREAFQYLLQDYQGKDVPIVTAAFWSGLNRLVAAEPWQVVFSNGGHLVQVQLRPPDEAINVWRSHYGLNAAQVAMLRALVDRRISAGNATIALSVSEKSVLGDARSNGFQLARDTLAGIGIQVQ